MSDTKTGRTGLIGNLALFLFSLFIAVLVVELILNFVPNPIKERYRASKDSLKTEAEPHPKHMYSMVNDYHWRLTPNSTVRFVTDYYDIQVNANSYGIRDSEYSDKDASTYRILGLGDSFAFGWGVNQEDSFYKQLQSKLASSDLLKRVNKENAEVINAGIPGFGTYEALEMLESLGRQYSPDLIVLAMYEGNDYLNNKSAPRKREIYQGYLKDIDTSNESELSKYAKTVSILYSALHDIFNRVREKMRFKHSIEKTKTYLKDLKKYSDELNAPVFIFIIPDQDPEFYSRSAIMRKYDDIVAGMNLYDAREELLLFGEDNDINIQLLSSKFENNGNEIALDKNDSHFNEQGHKLAASELLQWLEKDLIE